MPGFKKDFPGFEIMSKSLIPDDEFTVWDGEPGDLYEVEFNIQSMNNLFALAKRIGIEQYLNRVIKY